VPELPEVETVRQDLAAFYTGCPLDHLEVTGRRTVRRHVPGRLAALEGRALRGIGRHGKYLLFEWDDGQVLVAHLRMSGQFLAAAAGAPRAPHTHAVLSFGGAGELHFVDPRTFGELFLAETGPSTSLPPVPELAHMGPDALQVTAAHLATTLAKRRAALKALLVDQRILAGIGNIYSDEICWVAKLRPDRQGASLSRREVNRLTGAVHGVLQGAIAARGSTLADQRYRDLYGSVGSYQSQHRVYARAGQGCPRCGQLVEKLKIGAKSAYFCPRCQH